jgi:hypothetical protein
MYYKIQSNCERDYESGEPLCWSNEQGWVSPENATYFDEDQRQYANLPADSKWIPANEVKEDDFDEFLNEATHTLHTVWMNANGRNLDMDELYDLNTLIEGFFQDKRLG